MPDGEVDAREFVKTFPKENIDKEYTLKVTGKELVVLERLLAYDTGSDMLDDIPVPNLHEALHALPEKLIGQYKMQAMEFEYLGKIIRAVYPNNVLVGRVDAIELRTEKRTVQDAIIGKQAKIEVVVQEFTLRCTDMADMKNKFVVTLPGSAIITVLGTAAPKTIE